MKVMIQWILAVMVLSALTVWGPMVFAAQPSRAAGTVLRTSIVCDRQALKFIVEATTQGVTETERTIKWVLEKGGCVHGEYLVKIVAPAYTWEDFEGDKFQAWEIQPATNPPPPYPTFTWEHISGPNYPSPLMLKPVPFQSDSWKRQSI